MAFLALLGAGVVLASTAAAEDPHPQCLSDAFSPTITGDLIEEQILGAGFTPVSNVFVEIYESKASHDGGAAPIHGPVRRVSDSDGNVQAGESIESAGLDLVPGQYVVATDEATGAVKGLEMTSITVERADAVNDTVTGTARPGDCVFVQLHTDNPPGYAEFNWNTNVTTGADPSKPGDVWTADFRAKDPPVDITPQMYANAFVNDEDGDATAAFAPPSCPGTCSLFASIENDYIHLWNWTPNSDARVEVFESSSPGANRIYRSDPLKLDGDGRHTLDFGINPGPDLIPGNLIVATDIGNGATRELELVAVFLDGVDPQSDVVSGRAKPGIEVVAQNNLGPRMAVPADTATGDPDLNTWSADFNAIGYDIGSNDAFSAFSFEPDGDGTEDQLGAPLGDCVPDANTVCGSAGDDTLRTEEGQAASASSLRRSPFAWTARAKGKRARREIYAGPRDDTVLVTLRQPDRRIAVDTGTGKDGVVVDPGGKASRGSSALVTIRGGTRSLMVILPVHARKLRAKVTGTKGDDRVRTRRFARKAKPRGGYRIAGRVGDDKLKGGDGDDWLNGGPGRDKLIGGRGHDVCIKTRGDKLRSCEVVRRRG